jgi:hypothetical protein
VLFSFPAYTFRVDLRRSACLESGSERKSVARKIVLVQKIMFVEYKKFMFDLQVSDEKVCLKKCAA